MAIPILRQSAQTVAQNMHSKIADIGYKSLVVILDGKNLISFGDKSLNALFRAAMGQPEVKEPMIVDENGAKEL